MFEDISTFDTEKPIVSSPMREIDLNKKQIGSDFIKSLQSDPGKEFEIKKHLDRLCGIITSSDRNNNNNNNNGGGGPEGPDLYGPGNDIPLLPTLEDFLDRGSSDPPPAVQTPLNLNTHKPILSKHCIKSSSFKPQFFL